MGNWQACLSRNSNEEEEQQQEGEEMVIRVVRTTDNELFEFPGPVCVKDLLFGFQGFAVFLNKSPHSSSLFKNKQQPLHPDTLLKFSHLYYLKPLVNPSLIINPLSHHHDTKPLLAKQRSNWIKPSLIKPFINNIGTYSLLNKSDKDFQVLMSSAESSVDGAAEVLITQDKALNDVAGDLLAGDLNIPLTINAQEGSFKEHAEALITVDAQLTHALPEASLAFNSHDRALNELAEGLLITNAQEKPSSFDVQPTDQNPSQTMKVRKVRFSDEVVVIPSSNELFDSEVSPTWSPRSDNGTIASNEESIRQFGKGIGQFDKQVGYDSTSKEEEIPQMSKKEIMNGVVRLKVVISKKQLTELMASRASSDKQLMEKMLGPLLSPTSSCHKSESLLHGGTSASPSWRPSLHHIPEDHSLHELF